jgi:hypothetical protein
MTNLTSAILFFDFAPKPTPPENLIIRYLCLLILSLDNWIDYQNNTMGLKHLRADDYRISTSDKINFPT